MATAKKPPDRQLAVPRKQEVVNYDYGQHAGMGYEQTDQDDFAMPFLGLLQAMSPEVAEGTMDEARPGMLINSVTKELYDGKIGVFFVPVATSHVFVEWRPRESGGGIVARHEKRSEFVKSILASGEFGALKTPDGNDLVETFYMFGYLLNSVEDTEPGSMIVIGFNSTKIRVYKAIMQVLRTVLVPSGDGGRTNPPLFANRLLVKSIQEKNPQGTYFNLDIHPALGNNATTSLIPPTMDDGAPNPLLAFGRVLHEQVTSGKRKMADESLGGEKESTGGDESQTWKEDKKSGKPKSGKAPF